MLVLALSTLDLAPTQATVSQVASPVPSAERAAEASSDGLLFIENAGQFDPAARFQLWGGRQTVWLAEDALWLTIVEPGDRSQGSGDREQGAEQFSVAPAEQGSARGSVPQKAVNLRVSFPGANPQPTLEPLNRLDTHVSYFIGNDPARWRADVPVWGGVRYVDLYPGVDLIVGAGLVPAPDGGRLPGSPLPWRLEARAGADLAAVRLRVEGADAVAVDADTLRLNTAAGNLTLPMPAADRTNAQQVSVTRLDVQVFDVTAPLVLARTKVTTPTDAGHAVASPQANGLPYATFLGSSLTDIGRGIAVDSAGQAYATGSTKSANFPASGGPGYDTGYNGNVDAFVVKLNAAGTGLIYATFLGAGGDDGGRSIAVDGAGQAYVTGYTNSADFPASHGPGYDTSYNGGWCQGEPCQDTFVVKLNATGTGLGYATFLGGSGDDYHFKCGIAVDSAGQAYITGGTASTDFPVGPGCDTSYNGGEGDAFVVKLNAAGTGLRYATFLGGSDLDEGYGIVVDSAGQAYITGRTFSTNFPASLGPGYNTSYNGSDDAFVAKLDMPPWASWAQGDWPLLVPPAGVVVIIDYGNMTPPVTLVAQVTGAALFDTGDGGTTSINTTLPDGSGSYALRLIPAVGAVAGQGLNVQVDIGPVTLTKDGWIARQVWLPLILR